jgi:hypothetical protein
MADDRGRFSIPTRVLLTRTQRDRLLALCRVEDRDPAEIISAIVGAYLDSRQDLGLPSDDSPPDAIDRESLRRHLRRLRMEANRLGADAPAWLGDYIADLEHELTTHQP